MISSRNNPRIQHIRSLLSQRKTRTEFGEFVVEGVRLCEEASANGVKPRNVLFTPGLSERGKILVENFGKLGCEVEEIPESLMASISDTETSQGILAVFPFQHLPDAKERTFMAIADEIRDPGNLGSLIRSAAAAGVDELFITPGTADPYAPKVVRAGMGAHFHLPIRERSWEHVRGDVVALDAGNKPLVLLADMAGDPMWDIDLTKPLALIIGGEATGASTEARNFASARISIPMVGKMESLNAAIAGSILLFEVLRQRRK